MMMLRRILRQTWSPAALRLSCQRGAQHAHYQYTTDANAKGEGEIHAEQAVSDSDPNSGSSGSVEEEIKVMPDKKMKSRSRLQYIAVKQPSEALERTNKKILDSQKPKDAGNDIDLFKFTTDDLFRDILPLCAKKKKSLVAAEAYLATATTEQRLDLVHECRMARVERIKQAFKSTQLQNYLRQNGHKAHGNKDALVGRIIDNVWGISGRDFEKRLARASERMVADGLELPLSQESWDQLQNVDSAFLENLERDFKVKIELLHDSKKVKASGDMHGVRSALSALREGLAAYTTVEIDLKKYGSPRKLSAKHLYRLTARVSQGSAATVTNFHGELFVSGERSAALDAQSMLVDALTEDDKSSVFYALVPGPISQSLSTTVIPAAPMFSKPQNYIFESAIHVSGVSEFMTPAAALSEHALYSCTSGEEMRLEGARLLPTMAKWLEERQSDGRFRLCARLGRVLLDTDSEHEPLGTTFHRPADLLTAIGQRSPLFDFASYSSPLKWLNGAKDRAKTHLELTFRQVLTEAAEQQQEANRALPVCSSDKLVARIPMENAKILFDDMQLDVVDKQQNLNIAVLGAESDLQISGAVYRQIACTAGHRQALHDAVRQLGLLSKGASPDSQARRHGTIRLEEQPEGLFSLQDVVLDRVTTRRLVGGFAVDVRQTWNVVDDLRFSQVELRPEAGAVDRDQVDRFLGLLLQAAFESPTVPVTKAATFSIE